MPPLLLFCVAEEAKPFVRKALKVDFDGVKILQLVESRAALGRDDRLKLELQDDETFESDFIGASLQDCQEWASEKQKNGYVEPDFFAVADKRSAEDDTLLLHYYHDGEPVDIGGLGVFPEQGDTWHEFRIDYRKVAAPFVNLIEGDIGMVWPVYFGQKAMLTDQNGVFDVDAAERLMLGEFT